MVEAISTIFQLTTSRRGRPDRPSVDFQIWFFQLTTSRRGRPLQLCVKRLPFCLSTHDLTQRSTLHYNILWYIFQSFNSRPHAEVDKSGGNGQRALFLSTHDLTQRSTFLRIFVMRLVSLSTHDLTQRSTFWLYVCIPCIRSFNSRPHAEVDPRRSTGTPSSVSFNSRPHAEVDATC